MLSNKRTRRRLNAVRLAWRNERLRHPDGAPLFGPQASLAGELPLILGINWERLQVLRVGLMRMSRGSRETPMATPNPKKAVLQSAAADTYSKAGAEMTQAEPPLAKPDVSAGKPSKADRANDKARKSR